MTTQTNMSFIRFFGFFSCFSPIYWQHTEISVLSAIFSVPHQHLSMGFIQKLQPFMHWARRSLA